MVSERVNTVGEEKKPSIVGSKSFTAVAINCAAKAGEFVKSKQGTVQQLKQKVSSADLVTEVDRGSELLIRKLIGTHFPDHSFLGEEGVEPGMAASTEAIANMKDSEYLWIVDPIDGTTNFIHGFPFYCVSIALAYKGEVIVGVVYDPNKDELFVAEKGKGAYMHGQRLQVSQENTLNTSLLATGFPPNNPIELAKNMKAMTDLVPKVRNMRTTGSAALHLAYVAAGRISGFFEWNLNSWDLAAGALILQESGGKVTDLNNENYHLEVRNIVATNGHIHQELLHELNHSTTSFVSLSDNGKH